MLKFIPTPTFNKFSVGPLTIHAYALCIITGVAIAIWLGDKRYRASGGEANVVSDLALWVVPAGVIGGRLYHVITSPEYFFGTDGKLINVFKIYEGGLGIWGAVALGAAVAFWRYRSLNSEIPFAIFADSLAPGILIAQGVGRFGNWFNGELYGSATTLPWALEIPGSDQTYHPTFLYEALCNFFLAALLIKLGNRFKPSSIFLLYVGGYCAYRFAIEGIRIDEAHTFATLRLNQWVSLVIGSASFIRFFKINR